MKTILGIDPGKTTGLFMIGDECGFRGQPVEFKAVAVVRHLLEVYRPEVVVMESFNVFERRTSLARADIGWPLDIIGAVKWLLHDADDGALLVMRDNHQKNRVDDEMLEAVGWLAKPTNPMRHTNDAARHVFGWAKKNGEI